MNREEFIGKLQMVYVGDRNAFNEIVGVFDELVGRLADGIDYIEDNIECVYNANETSRVVTSTTIVPLKLEDILKGSDTH